MSTFYWVGPAGSAAFVYCNMSGVGVSLGGDGSSQFAASLSCLYIKVRHVAKCMHPRDIIAQSYFGRSIDGPYWIQVRSRTVTHLIVVIMHRS